MLNMKSFLRGWLKPFTAEQEMEEAIDRMVATTGLPRDDTVECAERLIDSHEVAFRRGRVRRRVVNDVADAFDYAVGNDHRVGRSAYGIQFKTRRLDVSIKIANMRKWPSSTDPAP